MASDHPPRVRPLEPGDPPALGRYRLTGRLGEGGMGMVFLAEAPDGRTVAVKIIRPHLARDPEFRRRFRDEVDRARQVPPFCTAEVLDADPDHDQPYLVVEYVDGPSLDAVVSQRDPLTPANLHGLAIGVATALTAIHGAGVIHRDLKPSNVLLAPGNPKVIDFGIARAVHGAGSETQPGQLLGTVAYMAPERFGVAGAAPVSPAADVFAWGAVVAYAGTGRTPHAADTPHAVAARILTQPPNLDGLSGLLRELVDQALAKDPEQRPTARELLDRLLTGGRHRPRELAVALADQPALLIAAEGRCHATGQVRARVAGDGTRVAAGDPDPDRLARAVDPAWHRRGRLRPAHLRGLWRLRDDTQAHGTTCAFAGSLVVTRQSAGLYRCPGPKLAFTDFSVSVNVKLLTPGSCAAVWVRFDASGYALRLCPAGYALVSHGATDANEVTMLRAFPFADRVPLNHATRIGISAQGRTLSFYRDGAHVGTVRDGTFQRGRVVLGVLQDPHATGRRTGCRSPGSTSGRAIPDP